MYFNLFGGVGLLPSVIRPQIQIDPVDLYSVSHNIDLEKCDYETTHWKPSVSR
mgnify:CR=1 FL=1